MTEEEKKKLKEQGWVPYGDMDGCWVDPDGILYTDEEKVKSIAFGTKASVENYLYGVYSRKNIENETIYDESGFSAGAG